MGTLAQKITVETTINAPVATVWEQFNAPEDITKWCFASDDWHAPFAENDVRTGGKFRTTMAAKDGSFSFDFGGVYSNVVPESLIEYDMEDGRTVQVTFMDNGDSTTVTEIFDAEQTNPAEMQKSGWQAILDNFKKHVEGN
ncbi:SRPBCC family protein [Dyadobacter chenwenxiniae]|uniref:SRPBCC family protein n=1 Tax=Dyadobacter chenwenxiniae TaxID=2906456 RepID=A0A9X1PLW9_9BACT|nr:SRPBCC family protein [Dyadobacter chenwenxiniae]MCF0063278.1 SRPBCC family protein [Dyadobacter chenwenxiniae]UON85342.1 SRPBCC family protein [Dyadobacter chenwenxiniae]